MALFKVALILLAAWVVSSTSYEHQMLNPTPRDRVDSVSYNADRNRFLSLANGSISVWIRSSTGRYNLSETIKEDGGLNTARFSKDGMKIAAGDKKSTIYIWTFNHTSGKYDRSQVLSDPDDEQLNGVTTVMFTDDAS